MTQNQFPIYEGVPTLSLPFIRQLSAAVRRLFDGKLNSTGEVTLTASTTTTTVTDQRVTSTSFIGLMPKTANAAAALGTTHVSARTNSGSFTLTHANNAQADRTFTYVIIG